MTMFTNADGGGLGREIFHYRRKKDHFIEPLAKLWGNVMEKRLFACQM
ncbi:MAG: hypothetical protein OXC72_15435 [Roseovarius sp.]|nr:hypothetical protein [Roseovarius sp.]